VLVADPDRRTAGILAWLLTEQGHDVSIAAGAAAVDQSLRLRAPDLLLIDGDDADVAAAVRAHRDAGHLSKTRIVAAASHVDAAPGLTEIVDDLVARPHHAAEVVVRVGTQLRQARELATATALAGSAEAIMEVIEENRRLEELATTDPVTLVLNRRAFADRLRVEMDRSRRFGSSLSILMIDIDHFKRVNDTAGHLAGDNVLREVASEIGDAVRTVDIVARYGGEEFVVILPETALEGAEVFGERLRERISGREFLAGDGKIRLTVSVGIATFPTQDVSTADELFARADSAMYRAKDSGRNQVRS
jgi:diguanylate cyclase (GGDEF)-like protein